MKHKIYIVLAVLLTAGIALAARDNYVEFNRSAKALVIEAGLYIGSRTKDPSSNTKNRIPYVLANTATIDFASTTVGVLLSSSITVTGAVAGDRCVVGVPTAAAALQASFKCYVDATNSVKVSFEPNSHQRGVSSALNGASPSVITVSSITASSVCTASVVGTAAGTAVMVSLSSTTLTLTGVNGATNLVNYDCYAPVDPASGTFTVIVFGQG